MTVKLSLSDEFYLLCKSDAPLNNYVVSVGDIHGFQPMVTLVYPFIPPLEITSPPTLITTTHHFFHYI